MIICTMPQCQTTAGCICGASRAPIGATIAMRPIDEDKVTEIVAEIGVRFRTFGGGVEPSNPFARSPLTVALKDKPLQFAAGVDVRDVVRMVLALNGERN